MNIRPQHLALLVLCCLIWAGTFIIGKAGAEAFSPLLFTALHYILVALILCPFIRWHRGKMGIIFAIALSMGTLHMGFFFIGLKLADNISVLAIVTHMEIPFAMMLSVILLHEQVRWRRITGFVLCVLGLGMISFDRAVFDNWQAIIFVLLSALAGAVGTILMRRLHHVGVFDLVGWVGVVSALMLIMLTLLFEDNHWQAIEHASQAAWGSVLYTALISSLIAYGLFYYLLQRYEVSLLSTLTSLVPVFGVILGVSIRGDVLTEEIMMGGLMILIGATVIIERDQGRERRSLLAKIGFPFSKK